MTGRGVDQILPHPSGPALHEPFAHSALEYVALAEQTNGPIPRPVDFDYIWGDALEEFARTRPAARIVNLETAITRSRAWEHKGINYRMNPANVPCLTAAGIDCCVLANNHVLDWGHAGLEQTLATLDAAGIATAGAGEDAAKAAAPAVLAVSGGGRVLVFACGDRSSGIPHDWAAKKHKPGVNLLPDLSDRTVEAIGAQVDAARRPDDIVIVSVHWGGNFGYEIPAAQRRFAHGLVDRAGADIVHGHSSHHPKGIEVYRGRAIFYGCGDLINDYEGIHGKAAYRGELSLMYFATFARSTAGAARLERLEMSPMRMRRFRLERPSPDDAKWLCEVLARESRRLGVDVVLDQNGRLRAHWAADT